MQNSLYTWSKRKRWWISSSLQRTFEVQTIYKNEASTLWDKTIWINNVRWYHFRLSYILWSRNVRWRWWKWGNACDRKNSCGPDAALFGFRKGAVHRQLLYQSITCKTSEGSQYLSLWNNQNKQNECSKYPGMIVCKYCAIKDKALKKTEDCFYAI